MPNSKRPAIEKWSDFGVHAAEDEMFERWLKWKDNNIGVCLGVASNIIAIDYDNDEEGLHAKIKAILPPSPVCKIGAIGETRFYQFNNQRSQSFNKNGNRVLDILSQGRQTVLPPSMHPDTGRPYYWENAFSTLENTPPMALPQIHFNMIHEIEKLFGVDQIKPHIVQPRHVMVYDDSKKAEVSEALTYIPSDDYDMWYRIGMSLKDKFGEEGFNMWDAWSATSSKYNSKEMRPKWNSFHGQGLTIASLFYQAMDNGFSSVSADMIEAIDDFEINGMMTGSTPERIKAAPKKEMVNVQSVELVEPPKQTESILFPPHLYDAPGLPGRLAAFVNKTALMPQPLLALGASIAAAGALMGRKVRSESNLRTNFYIIGLAPSGSGKDHARTVIKRMLHDTGLGDLELGVPASSAGLVGGLRERGKGRGLILWDEFGRTLKNISGFRAGTHEKEITTAMMELFSSAQSVYMGKAYANHDGKNPVKPLDQPCLSVYGTSVPNHFYDALSGGEAIDGFLARWLILESKDYTMEEGEREELLADIPTEIAEICKYWKEQPFNSEPNAGNLDTAMRVVPKLIKATEPANAYLKSFAAEMRRAAIQAELAGDNTGSVWSRAGEHARRLALVAHEGDQIELKVAEWAVGMAQYCSNYMAAAISDYVSSTELESQTKRILRAIKERSKSPDGWLTRAEISKCFQGIQARTRQEILGSLVERGEVFEDKVPNGQGRPKLRYRAIL